MLLFDAFLYSKPRGLGVFVRESSRCLSDEVVGQEWRMITRTAIREVPVDRQIVVRWFGGQVFWEQLVVPWYAWRLSASAVHAPANSFGVLFCLLNTPIIVTIHDLMFLERQGGTIKQRIGNNYRRCCYFVLKWCRRTLTTVSEASRRAIESSLQEEVSVTPNSCEYVLDHTAFDSANGCPGLTRNKPYFLHTGGLTANKNTLRVIEAWRESGIDETFQLVLLGDTRESFAAAFPQLESLPSIVTPGVVSSTELIRIVRGAFVSIFPSIEEGFGLPIVEAAFLGVPVITSNRPPMNELAPECSLIVDPESISELTSAIQELSSDEDLRSRLSGKTDAVRRRFGRDNLSRALTTVYEKVLR